MAFLDDIADLITWVDQPPPPLAGDTHAVGCTLFHQLITSCWQGLLFYRPNHCEYPGAEENPVLEGVLFVFPQVADFPSFDIKRVCALLTVQLIPDGEMSIAETALITEGVPDRTNITAQTKIPLPMSVNVN